MISFTVIGDPKPAGSKRAFVNPKTGRAIVTDDSGKKGKAWRQDVISRATDAYDGPLLDGPLQVTFTFYRERPKSHYRTGRFSGVLKDSAPAFPTTRPDALKLARSVEDACSGVLYRDDSQIVVEELRKRFGSPARVEVEIRPLPALHTEVNRSLMAA